MKSSIFFLLVFSCLLINSSLIRNQSEADSPEGTYFMHGTIIENTYDFPWGEEHLSSSDTTQISFATTIRVEEDKQDTVQFFGLAGANADRYHALPVVCENPDNCGYASFEMGTFQFDYLTPGGYFTGTGRLEGDLLILNTSFKYRGIGVIYDLQGERIATGEQ